MTTMRYLLILALLSVPVLAQQNPAGYREQPIPEEASPPPFTGTATLDERGAEAFKPDWPEAPPRIPHAVGHYQTDLNANRCLSCHHKAGARTESLLPTAAIPATPPTHFTDRDGRPTDTLAGRRYFCLQCHVPQHRVQLGIDNRFGDMP